MRESRRRCNPTEGHRTVAAAATALPAATTPRTAKRHQLLQLHVAFTIAPPVGEIITGVAPRSPSYVSLFHVIQPL